ncbi:MAG TPA: sugar ABC transporter permease [Clostridia bacterium]
MIRYKTQRRIMITGFLFVPLVLLLLFTYLPSLFVFYFSFQQWNGISDMEFVKFQNYVAIFTDPEIFKPLLNSFYYMVGAVVQMALGLFLATLLSFKVVLKNVFKGTFFFPYLINSVAVGLMFSFFFRSDGVLNSILHIFAIRNTPDWLRLNFWNNVLLAGVSIWKYMGFNLVMFIGAIQSISKEIYEAAEIDGANKFQIFFKIIYPAIRNIILLNLILAIKGAVSVYEIPYTMTGGTFGTSTFVIKTLQIGISTRYRQVGLASAMSFVLLGIVLVVTVIQRLMFKEKNDF